MPKNFQTRWDTEEEIAFIKSLSHIAFIGYRRGIALRQDWGAIDKDRIIDFINELELGGIKCRQTH